MLMRMASVTVIAIILVSVAVMSDAEGAEPSVKIARALAESASAGPMRVIVLLEAVAGETSPKAEHMKRAQEAVLSRTKGTSRAVRTFDHIPLVAMEVTGKDTLKTLGEMPEVRFVAPDRLRRMSPVKRSAAAAAAPLAYPQNADTIGAQKAWAAGYTGAGWYVAIPDTGVLTTHEMFAGKTILEACFAADRTCPNGQATMYGVGAAKPYSRNYDGYEHGTHVSGIAVGNSGKTFGVAKDASLIAIQVYSPFTSRFDCYPSAPPCLLSYDSDQLAALEYIYSLRSTFPIAAVSLSLGGGDILQPDAVRHEHG
jgi:hypothetical protein